MIEKVIAILTSYGYTVGYSPYHTDIDIKKYSNKKDQVAKDKFLTIYTPEGHVVGRLHELKQGKKFTATHLATIITYFEMFEIVHRETIIAEFKSILPKEGK